MMEGEACYPSTHEVKAGELDGHPWLHRKFEISQGYMTLPLKKKKLFSLISRIGGEIMTLNGDYWGCGRR